VWRGGRRLRAPWRVGARRRTKSPTSNVTRPRNLSQKDLPAPAAGSGPYSSGMSWSVSECTTGESGDSTPKVGRSMFVRCSLESPGACRCAQPQAAQQPVP
jgi:hypothetical protein